MKAKIFFTVLLLYMVEFVNCEKPTNSRSEADSKLTIITSLILSHIDLVTCLYVIGRTYFQWKKNNKNPLPKHLRFPFYIAIVEFLISIFQIIDWSVGELHPLCNPVGFISVFLLAFVMSLVTFISFVNWYKVKRDIKFNSGRYDYIIFLISSGFSIFYTLLGVNKYGKVDYWCAAVQPIKQNENKAVLYIILAIIIIHMSLLLTFYINTRMYLKRFKINQLSFNGQDLPTEDNKSYERMIAKKVLSYTLVYGYQLIILMFYMIISIGTYENTAVSLIRILGITIGGLLVAVQYIINEGWKDSPVPTRPPEKRLSQITAPSLRDSANIRLPFTRIQVEIVQQTTTQQDGDWAG